mgnify:CR=1 FL=1
MPLPLSRVFRRYRRWVLYIYAFFTVSLVAGTVYGWPGLRRKLREEGSTLSEEQLGAIYTVGAWSTQGVRFFTGLLRDRFGTQRIASFSLLSCAAGFAGMAWSDYNNPWTLGISMFVIGTGSGLQLCIQPVAGLFPNYSGSILSSLSGAFQISGLVFLALVKMGSRQVTFTVFAFVLGAFALLAVCFLPKGGSFMLQENEEQAEQDHDSKDLSSNSQSPSEEEGKETDRAAETAKPKTLLQGSYTCITEESELGIDVTIHDQPSVGQGTSVDQRKSKDNSYNDLERNEPRREESSTGMSLSQQSTTKDQKGSCTDSTSQDDPPTAMQQILSLEYILLFSWFSFAVTPLQYYVGSIGFQLEERGDDDGLYTTLFTVFYSAAAVFSPVGGWIADTLGLGAAEAFASVLCAVAFFCLASQQLSLNGQILGLICYGIGRMFVFGTFFAHVGKRFGYQNYGTLAGLGLILSALLSLLQYPMIAAASNGLDQEMNLLSGAIFVAMSPYFLWLSRKERTELSNNLHTSS